MFGWLFSKRKLNAAPVSAAILATHVKEATANWLAWFPAVGTPEFEVLEKRWVARNIKGFEFEKQGKIAAAVRLYEENVTDKFDGSHPYERLRIIYARLERWDEAIRACQAYLQFGVHGPDDIRAAMPRLIRKYEERAGAMGITKESAR